MSSQRYHYSSTTIIMRLKGLQLLLSIQPVSTPLPSQVITSMEPWSLRTENSKLKRRLIKIKPRKISIIIELHDFLPPHLVPLRTVFPHFLATKTAFSKLILFSIPGGRLSHRHGKSSFLISAQHAAEGFTLGPGILTYFMQSARRSPRSAPQNWALPGEAAESSKAATMAIAQTKKGALWCAMMKIWKLVSSPIVSSDETLRSFVHYIYMHAVAEEEEFAENIRIKCVRFGFHA